MQEKAKTQQIPVKVYRTTDRTTDRLMIATPMAGMQPEDIIVQVFPDSRLIVQGEVRAMLKDIKELLIDEWSIGTYYRELTLPNPVDATHANVTYRNGVLVIALPISQQTIPARLTLDKIGTAYGEHAGKTSHVHTHV